MSDKRKLPSNQDENKEIQLHDNGLKAGSLISQAVTRLSKEQADNLMIKAGEEALRLEAKQHELNIEYVHAKKTVEDHIDTTNMLNKGGHTTRHTVKTEVKSGNSRMEIESKSGATCFVATATYRDHNHPDVIKLRRFRDTTLVNHAMGRRFIAWYWRVGPKISRVIERHSYLRPACRFALSNLVRGLK